MDRNFANIEIKEDTLKLDSRIPLRGSIRLGLGLCLTSEAIKEKRKILEAKLP
jgi:hypothetical protein